MPPPVQLAVTQIDKPTIGRNGYQGLNPHSEVLPKGWNGHNARPLPTEILVDHDVSIKVRDGVTLYCDVFRPANSGPDEKVPAILAWSPFGKKLNGITVMGNLPWNVGIPRDTTSGLERFEGPDPAEYVPQGYAIVNVDARGTGDSGGSAVIMGVQEGEDGYDVIEGIAKLPWCTGNIGLAGNSHLGIVQWFIAAQKPPSLKAIAPWEAAGDLYREQFARGGVWDSALFDNITHNVIQGHNGLEHFAEMYERSSLQNSYWEDKRAQINKIQIPTYIVASYSTFVHTMGSIRGWLDVDTKDKWLRWDPYQEWFDLWVVKESRDELAAFFDKFLKDKDNGFEKTPRVRLSLLKFGDQDPIYPIEVEDYPIPNTNYTKYFLNHNETLSLEAPKDSNSLSYFSEVKDAGFQKISFKHTFDKKTRLAGMPKAVLYMSTEDSDDMAVYVVVRKLDKNGKAMLNLNIPWDHALIKSFDQLDPKDHHNLLFYFGPLGILRASRRHIDPSRSIHPNYPYHSHDRVELVKKGEVVELEIGLWAMGIEYEAGEGISVEIQGQYPFFKNYAEHEKPKPGADRANVGSHVVHIGGDHPSYVILPFI